MHSRYDCVVVIHRQVSTDELPSHTHSALVNSAAIWGEGTGIYYETGSLTSGCISFSDEGSAGLAGGTVDPKHRVKLTINAPHAHNISVGNVGGNSHHENRMPYEVVNRWKRTNQALRYQRPTAWYGCLFS